MPLARSTLFVAAPGNHDTDTRDPEKMGGNLAYFYYWDQPLNGPLGKEGGPFVPILDLPEAFRTGLVRAAGDAYPRMTNFSFDYGNAHWTVIDSNPYVDWTDPALKEWVAADLAAAQGATWRFVAFHHPGFNSAREHFEQQQMRLLAPVFEAGKVDVVFSGHVHNYQRSYPAAVRARQEQHTPGRTGPEDAARPGRQRPLDSRQVVRRPRRHDARRRDLRRHRRRRAAPLQPRAARRPRLVAGVHDKFISKVHSLTVADVDGKTLTLRQLSGDGEEVDRFVLSK